MKKILTILCLLIILPAFASTLTIESKKQNYDGAQNKTFLDGGVKVKLDDMTLTSPRAVVDITTEGKIDKATFLDRVHAVKDDKVNQHTIDSDIVKMSLLNKKIQAEGNTVSTFSEKKVPMVVLTANYQEYDINKSLMKASGNVIIKYQDVVATSNEADLKIDKSNKLEKFKLMGNAIVTQKDSVLTANQVIYNPRSNEIVAIGNTHSHAVSDDGSKFDLSAGLQQYDKLSKSLMASGSVKITYQNYIGQGPKATFLTNPKTGKINQIVFYGRSKVQEEGKIVEANKITMTLKPRGFLAEGNVKTSFKNVQEFSSDSSNSLLGGTKK